MATEENAVVTTPNLRREFLTLLKTIRTFKGDLSSFTAPAFLLSSTSLTEYPSYWAEQTQLLVAPAAVEDPAKRALAVLTWYICTLKQQYGRRDGKKKKPLNPFLGELFLGHFQDDTGKTQLVAEQRGVHLHGYNAQKTFFSGTIRTHKIGFVLLRLDKYEEEYLITLPKVRLEGLLSPPPHPELDGETFIQSSSGYTSKIEYSGKGWLKGKKNSFVAKLYKTDAPERPLNSVEGQWQFGSFDIRHTPSKELMETDSTGNYPLTPLVVAPLDEQDPLESRRAWHKVARAIETGDMQTVSTEKTKIEEEQRAMRRTERVEGTEWPTRYFTQVDSWPVLENLAKQIGIDMQLEGTKGMWKWDAKKYSDAKLSS